jgi:hypothetical protein
MRSRQETECCFQGRVVADVSTAELAEQAYPRGPEPRAVSRPKIPY